MKANLLTLYILYGVIGFIAILLGIAKYKFPQIIFPIATVLISLGYVSVQLYEEITDSVIGIPNKDIEYNLYGLITNIYWESQYVYFYISLAIFYPLGILVENGIGSLEMIWFVFWTNLLCQVTGYMAQRVYLDSYDNYLLPYQNNFLDVAIAQIGFVTYICVEELNYKWEQKRFWISSSIPLLLITLLGSLFTVFNSNFTPATSVVAFLLGCYFACVCRLIIINKNLEPDSTEAIPAVSQEHLYNTVNDIVTEIIDNNASLYQTAPTINHQSHQHNHQSHQNSIQSPIYNYTTPGVHQTYGQHPPQHAHSEPLVYPNLFQNHDATVPSAPPLQPENPPNNSPKNPPNNSPENLPNNSPKNPPTGGVKVLPPLKSRIVESNYNSVPTLRASNSMSNLSNLSQTSEV